MCAAGKVKKGMCMRGNNCHRLMCANETPCDMIGGDDSEHFTIAITSPHLPCFELSWLCSKLFLYAIKT